MAYDNPAGLIAMSVIFEALAIGMVLLRFTSRRMMRAGLRTDDWLIGAALLLGTGLCVIEIYGVAIEAFGYPLTKGSRSKFDRYYDGLKLQFAFLLLNTLAITLVKLSVVFLYRRLFTTSRIFATVSLVWIAFIISWSVAFSLWLIFECGSHVSAIWSPYEVYVQYCSQNNSGGYALVYTDLLTDLITLLMPIPIVAKLQTSFNRKIAITAVFAVGSFTVAASATRAAIYTHAQRYAVDDVLIMMTSLSVWTYLEVMVGICAACALTVRPVFGEFSFDIYASRFSSLRDDITSAIFSRRTSSISKQSGASTSNIFSTNEKHEKDVIVKARSFDIEASAHSDEQIRSESRHIVVERGYSVSMTDSNDDEISVVENNHISPFHPYDRSRQQMSHM